MACGILVPRPGIQPTSPALAGGFLTTGHHGSPLEGNLMMFSSCIYAAVANAHAAEKDRATSNYLSSAFFFSVILKL